MRLRLLTITSLLAATAAAFDLSDFDVTWTSRTPPVDGVPTSWSSMPIGNGDITSNVWSTGPSSFGLLVGKHDSYDELHQLLKLAEISLVVDKSSDR